MKNRRFFSLALAGVLVLSLAACGNNSSGTVTTSAAAGTEAVGSEMTKAETESTGNIGKTDIVFAMQGDIVALDPANQQDTTSGVILHHIYSTLLTKDDDGNLVPDLAESWEMSEDGTSFTYHLREDACFSDGTPVTAQDVKFTYDRAKNMTRTKSVTSKIKEVVVDNDHQVTINLTESYAPFKTVVTRFNLSILSEAAVTAAGDSYGDVDNILGSGPFICTEWVPNDHYVLTRNENYWGGMPITTTITCRVIPEGSARTIALETGEVDLVWSVDAIDCENIEANSDVKLLSQLSSSIEYVGMNTKKEIFSDPRVRQAVNYAVDKQVFVDMIIEGRGDIANSYINSSISGYDPDQESYPYDPAKAKELLAEAGYPDGFDCKIYVNGDVRTRSAQVLQAQLAEVGINAEIFTYEWGAFLDSLNTGEHDMFLLSWSNSSFDADSSTYQLFHSSNHGAAGNRAFLTDAKIDELIEQGAKETDDVRRNEIYKEIQTRLKEIAPWVPLYYKYDSVGIRADLKGFTLNKGGNHYLGNCHYEN